MPQSVNLSIFQSYIHRSRYARWDHNNKRRETWNETVSRYFDFFTEHLAERCGFKLTQEQRKRLEDAILQMNVMPSMRALMTARTSVKA